MKLSSWIITSASIIFNTRYLASPGYPLRSPTALPLFPKKALSPYKEGYLSQRRPSWDPAAQDEFLEAVQFGAPGSLSAGPHGAPGLLETPLSIAGTLFPGHDNLLKRRQTALTPEIYRQ